MLASVGFDAVLRGSPVASLSGGWKMKLALGALRAGHGGLWFCATECYSSAWKPSETCEVSAWQAPSCR